MKGSQKTGTDDRCIPLRSPGSTIAFRRVLRLKIKCKDETDYYIMLKIPEGEKNHETTGGPGRFLGFLRP